MFLIKSTFYLIFKQVVPLFHFALNPNPWFSKPVGTEAHVYTAQTLGLRPAVCGLARAAPGTVLTPSPPTSRASPAVSPEPRAQSLPPHEGRSPHPPGGSTRTAWAQSTRPVSDQSRRGSHATSPGKRRRGGRPLGARGCHYRPHDKFRWQSKSHRGPGRRRGVGGAGRRPSSNWNTTVSDRRWTETPRQQMQDEGATTHPAC